MSLSTADALLLTQLPYAAICLFIFRELVRIGRAVRALDLDLGA